MRFVHWILTENPFYPVQIVAALYFGWLLGRRFQHRCMLWIWIFPLASLLMPSRQAWFSENLKEPTSFGRDKLRLGICWFKTGSTEHILHLGDGPHPRTQRHLREENQNRQTGLRDLRRRMAAGGRTLPQRHSARKVTNPDATAMATELIVPLGFCLKGINHRNAEMSEIASVPSGDREAVNACRRRDHGVFCQRIRTAVHQARIFAKARRVHR